MSNEMIKNGTAVITIDALHLKVKIDNNFVESTKLEREPQSLYELLSGDDDKTSFKSFHLNPTSELRINDFELTIDSNYYRADDYKYLYLVKYKNVVFGHLCWFMHRRAMDKANLLVLDIDNRVFYSSLDYIDVIIQLLKELGLLFNNFELLDICVDSNFDILKRIKFYFFKKDKYYFRSCGEINKKMDDIRSWDRDVVVGEGIRFKSRGDILRIYNKTMEIAASNKYYISTYFKIKGLDVDKSVYRKEIHISRRSLYEKKIDIKLSDLSNEIELMGLFKFYWNKFVDFREINSSKRIAHYKRINILK